MGTTTIYGAEALDAGNSPPKAALLTARQDPAVDTGVRCVVLC